MPGDPAARGKVCRSCSAGGGHPCCPARNPPARARFRRPARPCAGRVQSLRAKANPRPDICSSTLHQIPRCFPRQYHAATGLHRPVQREWAHRWLRRLLRTSAPWPQKRPPGRRISRLREWACKTPRASCPARRSGRSAPCRNPRARGPSWSQTRCSATRQPLPGSTVCGSGAERRPRRRWSALPRPQPEANIPCRRRSCCLRAHPPHNDGFCSSQRWRNRAARSRDA